MLQAPVQDLCSTTFLYRSASLPTQVMFQHLNKL